MTAPLTHKVPRRLHFVLRDRMADEPVIVLHGPRSVGKSTLLGDLASELRVTVIDLDEPATRQAVDADPSFYATGSGPVLIDEFQHVLPLLDAIKAELNRGLTPGRYVLTGSTSYTTLPRAAQSLTGRVHVLQVWPLSQGEIQGRAETFLDRLVSDPASLVTRTEAGTARVQYWRLVLAGGMPIPLTRPPGPRRTRWFTDYVRLVIERDVLDIRQVRQREVLPDLLRRVAAQTASVLNASDLARRSQLDRSIVEDYLQLLEAVFMIHRLPAWGRTLGSRVGKAPKIHLVDSGLAAALVGLTEERLAARDTAAMAEFGHLLETFVVGELLKQASWNDAPLRVGHFRTHDGVEVDAVIEAADGRVVAVEVKSGTQIRPQDVRGLTTLRDRLGDQFVAGVVLYLGSMPYRLNDRIAVLPVDRLWS